MKRKLKLLLLLSLSVFLVIIILKKPKNSIPKSIEQEARIALGYFPELNGIPIEFKFKKNIKKSVMQAQPTWSGLLKPKNKRSYVILISEKFKISGEEFKTVDVPKDVSSFPFIIHGCPEIQKEMSTRILIDASIF